MDCRTDNAAFWSSAGMMAALAMLVGCAGGPTGSQRIDIRDLQDGQPRGELTASSAEEVLERAEQALRQGELDRALYFYVESVSLNPQDLHSLNQIGTIHRSRRNDELAIEAFQRVLDEDPDNEAALKGAGLSMFRMGRLSSAEPLLVRVAEQGSELWQVHDALGIIADLREDSVAATVHYTRAMSVNGRSAQVLNNRGYSRYLSGDLPGAAADFQMAVDIDPAYERGWRNLALVRSRQGRHAEALELLRSVSEESAALNDAGYLAILNRDYAIAERFLNEAITRSPTYHRLAHENLERLQEERARDRAR